MDLDLSKIIPFITRDMLSFGRTTSLKLRVVSQANAVATFYIRVVTREGKSKFSATTLSTGAMSTSTFNIPDIPTLISVRDDDGNFTQGSCYVTLSLLMDNDVVYELCSGYIYQQKGISWPIGSANDPIPNRMRIS